jgi:hypothetical protein
MHEWLVAAVARPRSDAERQFAESGDLDRGFSPTYTSLKL